MNKQALRQQLLKKRQDIDVNERLHAAALAAKIFINTTLFNTVTHIALYSALFHEFDTQALIEAIWAAGKKCYLPVITSNDNCLQFLLYDNKTSLKKNQFGILQPDSSRPVVIAAKALDLVFLPAIGFDDQRNRLGTGGGYYDRTFAYLQDKPKPTKPLLLALGYEFQRQPCPHDAWDVLMDGSLTEKQLTLF